MVKEMNGTERSKQLLVRMRESKAPLSGSTLGKETGVSRQVIVQDIALLRTAGHTIVSTPSGYYLEGTEQAERIFKVYHTNDQVEEELQTIIDLGGTVVDVMVNHRAYGKITAALGIRNRRDIKEFLEDIKNGKSTPLLNVTSGYHFHRISADKEETLDEIEQALREKGFLADLMPYEAVEQEESC